MSEEQQSTVDTEDDVVDTTGLPVIDDFGDTPEGEEDAPQAGAAPTAVTLTRQQVLQRAQSWIDEKVPYSQTHWHKNRFGSYRQDCSGYVSMCWALGHSYTTRTLHLVSHPIARKDLRPGDALLLAGQHVALFHGWRDKGHTMPVVDEESGTGKPCGRHVWSASYAKKFTPVRYNHIK